MFTGMESQLLQAIQKKDKAVAQAMLSDDLMDRDAGCRTPCPAMTGWIQ